MILAVTGALDLTLLTNAECDRWFCQDHNSEEEMIAMKTLRLFLLALLVTTGILVSAAPIIAATQNTSHPVPVRILGDDRPTPTPTPAGDQPEDCTGNGC